MHRIKRVIAVLVMLVVALAVLVFVLENQQGASLSFLGWNTAQVPVAVFVMAALVLGMVIGPLMGVLVGKRRGRTSVSN